MTFDNDKPIVCEIHRLSCAFVIVNGKQIKWYYSKGHRLWYTDENDKPIDITKEEKNLIASAVECKEQENQIAFKARESFKKNKH